MREEEKRCVGQNKANMTMKNLGYYTAKFGFGTIQSSNFYKKLPEYYPTIFLANLFSIAGTIHTAFNLDIDLRN